MTAKDVIRERRYGAVDLDFFWFRFPHFLEYQQALKVTIYCSLDFTNFPFDSHTCDLKFGSSYSTDNALQLDPSPDLHYSNQVVKYGDSYRSFNQSRIPFLILLESLKSFQHFEGGWNYSYTGMRIFLTRNDLGLLIGGFYGPTALFSALSLISYSINIDSVSRMPNG